MFLDYLVRECRGRLMSRRHCFLQLYHQLSPIGNREKEAHLLNLDIQFPHPLSSRMDVICTPQLIHLVPQISRQSNRSTTMSSLQCR